jgi:hypothetical protein
MPQVLRRPLISLNTDGERHPRENALAAVSFVLGMTALVLGFIVAAHLPAAIIGLIGLPVSLYSQMVSATTGERWLNVIAMIGSFIGLAMALAHGGFSS